MVRKAEIVVERFENGITTHWSDPEGNVDPVKGLATTGGEARCIGTEIWADICEIMNDRVCDKMLIKVEYQIVEGR